MIRERQQVQAGRTLALEEIVGSNGTDNGEVHAG